MSPEVREPVGRQRKTRGANAILHRGWRNWGEGCAVSVLPSAPSLSRHDQVGVGYGRCSSSKDGGANSGGIRDYRAASHASERRCEFAVGRSRATPLKRVRRSSKRALRCAAARMPSLADSAPRTWDPLPAKV